GSDRARARRGPADVAHALPDRRVEPDRRRRDAADREPHRGDAGAGSPQRAGDERKRKVAGPPPEQAEAPAFARPRDRNMDRDDELVRRQHGGEDRGEEIARRDQPAARLRGDLDPGVERHCRQWQLCGRVRVREAAAERAALADRIVADGAGRIGEHRCMGPGEHVPRQIRMAHQRATDEMVVLEAELDQIRLEDDHLVCGALMRHADLARHMLAWTHAPLLAYAAGTIGHYAIRQRGTLGGSLAHADPAAQLPLAAVTLDARIEIASQAGRRLVAARDFFASIFTTVLAPHELVVAVHVPIARPGEGWGFRLFRRRAGDFALALVACTLRRTSAGVTAVRLAVGGVAPTPVRLDAAVRKGVGDISWTTASAGAVAAAAPIEAHERLSVAYRRELIETLAQRALADAVESAA